METALRGRLKADAAVRAIIGTRVDWTVRPERTGLPAVVLQVIADPRPQHLTGFHSLRDTRVQIDCYGLTRDAVVTLREAVIAAIVPKGRFYGTRFDRAFINLVRDIGTNTDTGFVHADMIDATIWHGTAE